MDETTERPNALGNAWEQFKEVNAQRLAALEDKTNTRPEWINRHDYRFRIVKSGKRSSDQITLEYESHGNQLGCNLHIPPLVAHIIQELLDNPSRESDNG